ncbi:MAG: glucosamine-6-phosphate deaminase [Phycisphaerales bacterium]|nr:glucosamine-6-phosphate deaminase [Phycisphaerales bacterium]
MAGSNGHNRPGGLKGRPVGSAATTNTITSRDARMRRLERVPVVIHGTSGEANRAVAGQIAELIRDKAERGERAVLGLATGSTPTGVYDELVRMHREERLSFRNVVTFNLDEYWPMQPDRLQSYVRFMREHLFDHVDIPRASVNIPDGTAARERVGTFCEGYERAIAGAGGIDLQILGIGRTGHVGFNEPGSSRESRTRLITLDRVTRMDAASDFFGEWHVPRQAITMGVGTILDAKRIILLAFGEHKAGIIRRAVEGEITPGVAASYLQEHRATQIVLDEAASAELTRVKTPWMLGSIRDFGLDWTVALTRRATIWLALTLGKPILKLTDEDYSEHGLQELVASSAGGAYDINIEVFRSLQGTITGWPAGRAQGTPPPGGVPSFPTRSDTGRPSSHWEIAQSMSSQSPASERRGTQRRATQAKRVVLFSPHPDDDVISMGGTFIRLCDQGHEVHVAYQTSGNIAVWDETALRHADFVTEFAGAFFRGGSREGERVASHIEETVERFIKRKRAGEIDIPELRTIKSLIRRTEARAGARFCGVADEGRIHFLDLPFYETGKVRKQPLGSEDIRIVAELLDRVKPDHVYAAGDLSDPHGTHRVCLAAILRAIESLQSRPWMKSCEVWLYRGAWQEWEPHEIDMAVPLSPDEVKRKRMAIFKHESQKDKALFPGPNDPREFWQRAEDRNRNTAQLYDRLGLTEYEAMEGFVRLKPASPPIQEANRRASKHARR